MIAMPDLNTPVLVQGITGRAAQLHTRLMLAYGTRIVAGTSSRADAEPVEGVPVFPDCAQAVAATGATASITMVPPLAVADAVAQAIGAGIRLVVSIAEGVPVHDAMRIRRLAEQAGATWLGASTPGLCIPGEMKLGFLPDAALLPGPIGVISKSGTLSYEVCYRLKQLGLGQSAWIGVGGDLVKGTRFPDLLPYFAGDPRTQALVVVGEIGGTEEEDLATAIAATGFAKPTFVLIAGSKAREGVTMGHAGALVHGTSGTVASKTRAIEAAGGQAFTNIDTLVMAVARQMGR